MLMRKVAIVGYNLTPQTTSINDTRPNMIFQCVKEALKKSGISRDDITSVIMGANDFYDGHTISNVFSVEPSGAYLKDESKVEQDGLHGLIYAAMRIASGNHDAAMCVAYSKASEFENHAALAAMLDPTYDRAFGLLDDVALAALQARAYMSAYGISEADLAAAAVKNLAQARKNPTVSARKYGVSESEVLGSKMLYSPLREMMVYPPTDGCAVAILACEEKAKKFTDKPVWIKGIGLSQENYYLGERNLAEARSVKLAGQAAYKMAGIADPKKEINLFELSDMFANQELQFSEALGLCGPGEGAKLLKSGATAVGGAMPVNASGGPLAACALAACGLVRAIECTMQIRGEAGERQVANVKTALAHGQTGMAAQNSAVIILGK